MLGTSPPVPCFPLPSVALVSFPSVSSVILRLAKRNVTPKLGKDMNDFSFITKPYLFTSCIKRENFFDIIKKNRFIYQMNVAVLFLSIPPVTFYCNTSPCPSDHRGLSHLTVKLRPDSMSQSISNTVSSHKTSSSEFLKVLDYRCFQELDYRCARRGMENKLWLSWSCFILYITYFSLFWRKRCNDGGECKSFSKTWRALEQFGE